MGQLGGLVGRAVHRVDALHQRVVGVGEDLSAELGVVAVEADDQRLGDLLAAVLQQLQRLDDAVGDLVAGGDAAEDLVDVLLGQGRAAGQGQGQGDQGNEGTDAHGWAPW